ncbi:nitroreductase/quinone reductase family protein [Amycolatopsis pigmentata]|uniref:Nitroreductase/quinone reductase family protein n=1 Tax=Amycolatopsis pigmentata TaxID=450801 RepID=A0ABW5G0A2_9PSEU
MNETRYITTSNKADHLFNRSVAWLAKHGVSLMGTRLLGVRGRKSGELRSTPVNLMYFEGERYLISPRGHTQWVRNLRVAGEGQLVLGRRTETFRAIELTDEEKPPLLRFYLKKWAWEVGRFFEGVDKNSPDEVVRGIAPGVPAFRITAD